MKYLPIIIIIYWTLLFPMVSCEWYKKNSQLIDDIDTFIVGASLLHYFVYYKKYSLTSQYCLKGIISVLFLHFCYYNFHLNDQTYYIFYCVILAIVLYFCITENWNR